MIQDEDFIIRQVQQLAKGLGKFMGLEGIKDLLMFEQDEDTALTDEQLETIILATHLEEIQKNKEYTLNELSQEVGIKPDEIEMLYENSRFATEEELSKMREYVEKNQEYLNQ